MLCSLWKAAFDIYNQILYFIIFYDSNLEKLEKK